MPIQNTLDAWDRIEVGAYLLIKKVIAQISGRLISAQPRTSCIVILFPFLSPSPSWSRYVRTIQWIHIPLSAGRGIFDGVDRAMWGREGLQWCDLLNSLRSLSGMSVGMARRMRMGHRAGWPFLVHFADSWQDRSWWDKDVISTWAGISSVITDEEYYQMTPMPGSYSA